MAIPTIRLPHPYLTSYTLSPAAAPHSYRLLLTSPQPADATLPPLPLHNDALSFTLPAASPGAPDAAIDNTPYARARRSLHSTVEWSKAEAPTVSQIWLLTYALFSKYHAQETLRVTLTGAGSAKLSASLLSTLLALPHPFPTTPSTPYPDTTKPTPELLLSRSTFWQGAASPFGPRPVWTADPSTALPSPGGVLEYTFTTAFPSTRIYKRHPVRAPKPAPGSIVYSRWLPHLNEHLTLVAVDWRLPEHLNAFHTWQNDPHVSAGWNQSGPESEHRDYLAANEKDPHILSVFGAFEGELFGYFEVYWGPEDHLGAYYESQDWDRGRHSLVGNRRLRGPHRVRAWWSGLMHYCFLDEPRTMRLVGEPREGNEVVAQYDRDHGFWHQGSVDLPHKRANLAIVTRERFFALSKLHWGDESGIEGERAVKAVAKL